VDAIGTGDDMKRATRRGRVATFSISLLFRHPSVDPASVTAALGVQPTTQARVGDNVRPAVDGTPRRGTERESAWGVRAKFYEKEPDIGELVTAFLQPFVAHAAFMRDLAAGSTVATIDLEFPGQFHFGGALEPAVLHTIADMGLMLGIEVFPDSAT
jgi:hypothetical protein